MLAVDLDKFPKLWKLDGMPKFHHTTRAELAAAIIAKCDHKTVKRHLKGKLPVRDDTGAILDYVLTPPRTDGPSAVSLLLERADLLNLVAQDRTGRKRR